MKSYDGDKNSKSTTLKTYSAPKCAFNWSNQNEDAFDSLDIVKARTNKVAQMHLPTKLIPFKV